MTAAFGGGGPFGIAYAYGVVDALTEAGLHLHGAKLLGTSAGSWVASCVATGVPFARLGELPPVRVPNLRPGMLAGIAAEVLGDARSADVSVSAVKVSSGRRTLLRGDEHRLADLVAASSAVPWLFAPGRVNGHRFFDGGVRSMVSADLAPPAHHLLVVAPIAGPMFGRAGRTMEALLQREIRRWQHSCDGMVHLIRPNREIASMARNPLDLFDHELARLVYPLARKQAEALAHTREEIPILCSRPVEAVGPEATARKTTAARTGNARRQGGRRGESTAA